jgi:hypothetical protein
LSAACLTNHDHPLTLKKFPPSRYASADEGYWRTQQSRDVGLGRETRFLSARRSPRNSFNVHRPTQRGSQRVFPPGQSVLSTGECQLIGMECTLLRAFRTPYGSSRHVRTPSPPEGEPSHDLLAPTAPRSETQQNGLVLTPAARCSKRKAPSRVLSFLGFLEIRRTCAQVMHCAMQVQTNRAWCQR